MTAVINSQSEVINFLSKSSAYGLEPRAVNRCETHGAIVFLVGDRAYKLKRAVRFPYMDYSSVERRHAMCQAEISINRPLAPEIYIGVRPIVRNADGTLRIGSAHERDAAVDWLVVMHRFDQSALFSSLCDRGALTVRLVRQLAERIAVFHQHTLKSESHGGLKGISTVVEECSAIFGKMTDALPQEKILTFERLAREALLHDGPLLEARRLDGHVRRCHGDLHLNNICLLNGTPVLFDAIEFSDDFACIDLLYDFAFLVMDLERHGRGMEANVLLNRYLARTGDYTGMGALPLFLACRAAIRAHVTVTAAIVAEATIFRNKAHEATQLLELSVDYLTPKGVRLIAIGGLSGTGKSTLAASLAPTIGRRPGAIVVRTDELRKELWGIGDELRLPQGAYSKEFSSRVYAVLAERTSLILKSGQSVIADGVFGTRPERDAVRQLAEALGISFSGLWLEGPQPILEKRIEGRIEDVSDATVAVLHSQMRDVEVPHDWKQIFVAGPAREILSKAKRALD
jgi:hypothetical protein